MDRRAVDMTNTGVGIVDIMESCREELYEYLGRTRWWGGSRRVIFEHGIYLRPCMIKRNHLHHHEFEKVRHVFSVT